MVNSKIILVRVPKNSLLDMNGKGQMLSIAVPHYPASEAWIKSYKDFFKIGSTEFSIITGNNNNLLTIKKYRVTKPTQEDIEEMLPKCHYQIQRYIKKLLKVPLMSL